MRSRILSVLFAISSITIAHAEDGLVETSRLGLTDWGDGYIDATGHGTARYMSNRIQEELMAKQAARTVAQARLLELINGVRVTGLTTLGAQSQSDTRAATRIKGTIRGARVVDEKTTWHKDTSSRRGEVVMAEVTLRLCISAACTETKDNLTRALLDLPTGGPDKQPAPIKGYSSVIIDLNQALFLPALSPEIINEDETVIYSQEKIDNTAMLEKGLVHYVKTTDKAKSLSITGSNPLIVTALRITKDNRIVISNQNSSMMADLDALKQGRLIVALD